MAFPQLSEELTFQYACASLVLDEAYETGDDLLAGIAEQRMTQLRRIADRHGVGIQAGAQAGPGDARGRRRL